MSGVRKPGLYRQGSLITSRLLRRLGLAMCVTALGACNDSSSDAPITEPDVSFNEWQALNLPEGDIAELKWIAQGRFDQNKLNIVLRNAENEYQLFSSFDAGNQWNGVAGPDLSSGRIDKVYADPAESAHWYLTVCNAWPDLGGGIYRTDNEGQSWEKVAVIEAEGEQDISACPSLFFGVNAESYFVADRSYHSNWVSYSADKGESWSRVDSGGYSTWDFPIINPFNANEFYVLDQNHVRVMALATDQNETTQEIGSFEFPQREVFVDTAVVTILADGVLVMAEKTRLLMNDSKSNANWKTLTLPGDANEVFALTSWQGDAATGLVIATDNGVWISFSRGARWQRLGDSELAMRQFWVMGSRIYALSQSANAVFYIDRLE
ncbi:hypothetical protein [Oleiphilus messinensis]|nr:hypothetical protein [Oleiphilus messinensis]